MKRPDANGLGMVMKTSSVEDNNQIYAVILGGCSGSLLSLSETIGVLLEANNMLTGETFGDTHAVAGVSTITVDPRGDILWWCICCGH